PLALPTLAAQREKLLSYCDDVVVTPTVVSKASGSVPAQRMSDILRLHLRADLDVVHIGVEPRIVRVRILLPHVGRAGVRGVREELLSLVQRRAGVDDVLDRALRRVVLSVETCDLNAEDLRSVDQR